MHFSVCWCFVLLSYIGPALGRTMVQSSNLVCLESDVGPFNGFSFASPMCFSYFVYFAYIMLYYVVWGQFALVF